MNYFFDEGKFQGKLRGRGNEILEFVVENQLKNKKMWDACVFPFENNQDGQSLDAVDGGWRGEFWGKLMRGSCMVYRYAQDEELYHILETSILRLMDTQELAGRISTYPPNHEFYGWDMWGRKYVLLGMMYFYQICTSESLKKKILSSMSKQLDYIVEHIGNGESQILVKDTSDAWGAVNSHTILEPVMYLYKETGKASYLQFADMLVENGGAKKCNLIELALNDHILPYEYPVTKAYEIMSFFIGLLEYAEVTGKERYKEAVEKFAEKLLDSEITIIGSAGCTHEQFDHGKIRQALDSNTVDMMQETCVTVTWMDLCSRLLKMTNNSKYADEIEKSAYNALFGAVNTDLSNNNGGLIFDSYTPSMGGTRGNGIAGLKVTDLFSIRGCCDSIGALGAGIFLNYAVVDTENGMTINFYEKGEIIGKTSDKKAVKFTVDTEYPLAETVVIKFTGEEACEFTVNLRIPEFSKHTTCTVNGKNIDGENGYFKVQRMWKNQDTIELKFEMSPVVVRSQNDHYAAIKCGPLVMARDRRIDQNVSKLVHLDYDQDTGIIKLDTMKNSNVSSWICCEHHTEEGEKVILMNCASAGKTWDEKSEMEIWMKLK